MEVLGLLQIWTYEESPFILPCPAATTPRKRTPQPQDSSEAPRARLGSDPPCPGSGSEQGQRRCGRREVETLSSDDETVPWDSNNSFEGSIRFECFHHTWDSKH
ncbi:hypothetical protein NDU88_006368 [Pleurodeles waltl]|uniref:Uncharacterized protein n=1 Tax=Pleurodeles waltl TaxID=8319 RepID=A0AAV7PLK9_PLEWA|nr:hypothetical protein NDU88_006368 [Pleurodeles waltl]